MKDPIITNLQIPSPDSAVKRSVAPERPPCGTVLLVEDDAPLRQVLSEMLRSQGYAVLPARDGNEALQLARDGADFDLLFTDMKLPGGLCGCEVADEMHKLRPELPVLFTSGHPDSGNLPVRATFLMKPYKLSELEAALSEATKHKQTYAKSA